jgi:hypothetical protein
VVWSAFRCLVPSLQDESEDLTCEVLNGHLRCVLDRSLPPDARQSRVDALVKLCNTGEIRDVTPGFDTEFYNLLFKVLKLAFDESQQLTHEPEKPDDNPLPTDGTAPCLALWCCRKQPDQPALRLCDAARTLCLQGCQVRVT